jgi:hypothetical protein
MGIMHQIFTKFAKQDCARSAGQFWGYPHPKRPDRNKRRASKQTTNKQGHCARFNFKQSLWSDKMVVLKSEPVSDGQSPHRL